ncbi:HD domain-containing protein [Desulfonatronum thioautotrophicum]|uniref:[protein-PII] uridylyltransferase family protein n=1 Tax=Desulfonatronum thioautotrophicum TaxID=617001 RepID=UPI0005EBB8E6|nr:HD domain-containing protein [Desulfonatronum thioautotrophicum]
MTKLPAPPSVLNDTAASRLRAERNELLRTALAAGSIPADFSLQLTRLTDRYFQTRVAEILSCSCTDTPPLSSAAFVVVAVGGYGQETLCPGSDLDVLVLFQDNVPATTVDFCQDLFLPLWDLGLELGHSVRRMDECLRLADEDQKTFTALLSARYLTGDTAVMRRFAEAFIQQAAHHDFSVLADIFDPPERTERIPVRTENGVTENDPRVAEFDFDLTAENLLEPNLKSTPGGLRDYHRLLWLAVPRLTDQGRRITTSPAGPFTDMDVAELHQDVSFLLRTRSALHLTVGRKADVLHLEMQREVARLLGFVNPDSGLAVEVFLGRLHRAMERIRAMYLTVLRTLRGLNQAHSIRFLDQETKQDIILAADGLALAQTPAPHTSSPLPGKQIMALFKAMGRTGLPLSWTVRSQLAAACPHLLRDVGERFATLQELAMILAAPGGRQAGRDMLATGVLVALIPELGRVQDHIQFDAYHLRPVGAHTVEAIGFLSTWRNRDAGHDPEQHRFRVRSREAQFAAEIWQHYPEPTALILGTLLHDIAKGDPDHAEAGAKMAAQILRRFQAPEGLVGEVEFLVREHLLLFKTATRRDLHDEQVVAGCAERIGKRTHLDQLMLLSMADARATGPKAWNAWNAALLRDLYFKIRKLFTHGPLSHPQAMEHLEKLRITVLSGFSESEVPPELDGLLHQFPLRYLLTTPAETIIRHIRVVERLKRSTAEEKVRIPGGRGGLGLAEVEVVTLPDAGCHEVTFAVMAQPGIFPVLCGVLTLHGLNVLAAEMISWPEDVVLSVFKTQDPPDLLHLEELAFRLKQSVKFTMTGKLFLTERLAEKWRSQPKSGAPPSALPPTVHIDNESNDFSTQIEIVADDGPGCLYRIAETFERLQVRIIRAKIATQADRIADSFDVRDHLGQKITDTTEIHAIRQALIDALSQT